MKCRTLISISIALLMLSFETAVMAQSFHFYTETGKLRNLQLQNSEITVKLSSPFETFGGMFLAEEALDNSFAPEILSDGFYRLKVKPGHDAIALVDRLRGREDVLFANLSFLDPLGSPIYLTESFAANFYPTTPQAQIDSMNNAHSVIVVDSLFNDPYCLILRLTENSDMDVLAMGNAYHESDLVQFARAGVIIGLSLMADPNDPYWQYQWNFKNTGQTGGFPDADIDLELAYEYHTPSSGSVIVALLDDGFVSHEYFPQSRIIGGFDYAQQDFTISPGRYGNHGMACVGQIAGAGYNSVGIAGIALYAKILGQKIVRDNLIFAITDTELARAFSDAVLSGARIINNSWGCAPGVDCGFEMDSTTYWIRKADSAGVLVVFAAGNEGALMRWPADLEEVVAVGATDHRDMKQPESSYGSQLDIMAPSGLATGTFGNVWTLDQMGFDGVNPDWYTCTPQDMNYDCHFGGTSAACAQASGVAAMILQRRPDLVGNTEMLKKILRYSSERTPFDKLPTDTARVDDSVGWGRLNAARALLSVVRGDANNSGSITPSDPVYVVNYIFNGGPAPYPHLLCGDADGNGAVSISDIVRLVSYIYQGGAAPPVSFKY